MSRLDLRRTPRRVNGGEETQDKPGRADQRHIPALQLGRQVADEVHVGTEDVLPAVRIVDQPKELRLTVENTGQQISEDLLPRLFDRFYRADPARREGSSEHAGLGLATTQSIIRAHGGQIRCESENGWTRFVIELPRGD
ncbi:UNVERIFIED_ORG: signal transduction histidine kinase [Pseudomonas reinekei]